MRVAGIDIGSNTIRMLVADVIDGAIVDVARRTEVVGLGRGMEVTGVISAESLAAAGKTLRGFADVLEVAGPDRVRVVATAASRDAGNSDALRAVVVDAVGAEPEIIGGDDEAALSFAGASWATAAPGPYLVIDPGGGSTEFVFGLDEPEYTISIDIGSVRLADRLLPDRPATPAAIDVAGRHVADLFAAVSLPAAPATVIGVAGTFRALAAVHLGLGYYDRNMTHGVVLTQGDLDALVTRFGALTLTETEAIASLPPGRAPVILAGAIVAAEAVRVGGTGAATISKAGLLQGMVLEMAG